MVPPRVNTAGSDQKVYELIMGYLEGQCERARAKNGELEDEDVVVLSDFDVRPFLKKLTIMEAVNFCKDADFKLKRSKSAAVAKMVEKVFAKIRNEQEATWADADAAGADFDNDIDGIDLDNMMEVSDTNQQNKSVVSLWNIQPAQTIPSETDIPSTPNANTNTAEKTEEVKKSKKRDRASKEKEPSSKRQKGMLYYWIHNNGSNKVCQ